MGSTYEWFMEYERYRDFSLAPISFDSLRLATAAISVLRHRYSNMPFTDGTLYPSTDTFMLEIPELGNIPESWDNYARHCQHEDLWHSILKKNTPIHATLVNSYLNLLKKPHLDIAAKRIVTDGTYSISDEGNDRITVIPLEILTNRESSWAFIVAYANCIHYYNSQKDIPMLEISDKNSREVQTAWTGPKEQEQDNSGVYMLLGIRRIVDGLPHIGQLAATGELLYTFRVRILVELLCGRLDPTEEEFHRFVEGEYISSPSTIIVSGSQKKLSAEESTLPMPISSFGAQNTSTTPRETPPGMIVDNSEPATHSASEPLSTGKSSSLNTSSPIFSVNTSATQGSPATSSRSRPSPQSASNITNNVKHFNTMRGILNLLSKASLACRLSKSSEKTSLAILWHLVKEDRLGSIFHQRYNAVLFYKRMEEMQSEEAIRAELKGKGEDIRLMRTKKTECEFWNNICKIGEDFGWKDDKKYVMLLAISSLPTNTSQRRKKEVINELRRYLEDTSEPLKEWLLSAQQLSTTIVKQSLPNKNLMIDLYHLKKGQEINETTYKLFVSIDPHEAAKVDWI